MVLNWFLLIVALAVSKTVNADPMYMEFYENNNYTGQSIVVHRSHENFNYTTDIIGGGSGIWSYCYVGNWKSTTYGGTIAYYLYTTRRCFNDVHNGYEHVTSVKRCGPPDTATPAATFDRPGAMLVVEAAHANVGITSGVLVGSRIWTTGRSNWTLYELENYAGRSVCITSTTELHRINADTVGLPSYGSAIRGCTGKQEHIAIKNLELLEDHSRKPKSLPI